MRLVTYNAASDWNSVSGGGGRRSSPQFEAGGKPRNDVAFAAASCCWLGFRRDVATEISVAAAGELNTDSVYNEIHENPELHSGDDA